MLRFKRWTFRIDVRPLQYIIIYLFIIISWIRFVFPLDLNSDLDLERNLHSGYRVLYSNHSHASSSYETSTIWLNYPVRFSCAFFVHKNEIFIGAHFPANAHVHCNRMTQKEIETFLLRIRWHAKSVHITRSTKFKYSMHMASGARIFHLDCFAKNWLVQHCVCQKLQ